MDKLPPLLPPGWEAKWDPGQNRYFFINHTNHTTTWVDPRTTQPAPSNQWAGQHNQQVRHSPQVPAKAEHIPMSQMGGQSTKPQWQQQVEEEYGVQVEYVKHAEDERGEETTFADEGERQLEDLKKKFPTAPDWKIKNALARLEYRLDEVIAELERSGYQQQDLASQRVEAAIVNKLNKEFPSAEVGVIRDIVQCFENNKEKARSELVSLGYTSQAAAKSRESSASPRRAVSPTKTPVKPKEPSAAEKERMKAKLAAEFPSYSATMIDIALNSCSYEIKNARKLINSMLKQRKESAKEDRSRSPTKARTRSPTPVSSPASTSTTGASSTSHSQAGTPSFSTVIPETGTSFTFPSGTKTSGPASPSARSQTPVKRQTPQSAASRLAKSPKKSVSAQSTRKSDKRGTYVSAHRTLAKGPNPALARGSDVDLLIDDYQPCSGPNKALCHGPDPNNVHGPSAASGPDASLRQGPDSDSFSGADADLWKGSNLSTPVTQRVFMSEV